MARVIIEEYEADCTRGPGLCLAQAMACRECGHCLGCCDEHDEGCPVEAAEHCWHHQHDEGCPGAYGDCDDAASDHCVQCECCCIYEVTPAIVDVPLPEVIPGG